MERIQRWRAALTDAANYAGCNLDSFANGYEAKFVEKIVEEVLSKLNVAHFHVAKHPVGILSRVEKMKALLNLGTSDHIRVVGIYGMGGIGKTTVAKAVYNQIYEEFEGSSFLSSIKESSGKHNGLVGLQKQLLRDILKYRKDLEFGNVDRGFNLIKERLHGKKVLIVLDDVNQLEQIHTFVGNCEWFGSGTRVIVTTRDEHLLEKSTAHEKYRVEELTHSDSLELLSWHAFNMPHPKENYDQLSISIASYAGGLPLALEVLGGHLFNRSIIQWRSTLEKLEKIPHSEIQQKLKISFDSLGDDRIKDIFLDIACFFIGMDKEYATKIFHGCGFFPDIDLNILIERSLVTVDYINMLRMHDMIRDMGREIIRETSPKNRSLWFHEDVLSVQKKQLGSDAVEGLVLNLPKLEDECFKTEAFANMKNLRLLQINNLHLTGCFEHLSKELRWLSWHKCPLKFLPPNFDLANLVVLEMQRNNVKQVWKENRVLNKLKVLNLSHSKNLFKLPDFVQVPNLETLIVEGCISLVELDESVGYLKGLVLLSLKGCKSLKNLPESICRLKTLETLNLFGC
ncbi:disease resistance protein RUN1-like [Juglans microcarpa x Juglans regia]|uniref:disease resistance protein RUN1-like n=1 Tax=Juglans microcarpa x Juglans regia TaxID=2249226 RepID=UPI001B7E34F5|nr:disease resistance protein RUN1-like [Juglans microcarpa x Juglans regia]